MIDYSGQMCGGQVAIDGSQAVEEMYNFFKNFYFYELKRDGSNTVGMAELQNLDKGNTMLDFSGLSLVTLLDYNVLECPHGMWWSVYNFIFCLENKYLILRSKKMALLRYALVSNFYYAIKSFINKKFTDDQLIDALNLCRILDVNDS